MKKICIWLILFISPVLVMAQQSGISIVPQPVLLSPQPGNFTFTNNILISAPASTEVQYVTDYLKNKLGKATGYAVTVGASNSAAAIQMALNKTADTLLGKEGYKLSVTATNITITANQPRRFVLWRANAGAANAERY